MARDQKTVADPDHMVEMGSRKFLGAESERIRHVFTQTHRMIERDRPRELTSKRFNGTSGKRVILYASCAGHSFNHVWETN